METENLTAYPSVVIIGGGFGGIALAKKLKERPFRVLMLDRHNYHTFQPLLYQVATGGLEADSIAFPLRKTFKDQSNFQFRNAEVTEIVAGEHLIRTSIGEIPYDYLVIATGSDTNYFGSKELEHFTMPMKTIPQALNLRSMILQNLEAALVETDPVKRSGLLNFVIVGGGPTGVELSGAIAELKKHILATDYPELDIASVRIYIIEGSGELLGPMSAKSQRDAKEFLQELGVVIKLNTRVVSYNGEDIHLSTGEQIRSANVLWSAGVMGEVIPGIPEAAIGRGNRILVDEVNRVNGFSTIFAIGDVAAMHTTKYPNGHPGVAPAAQQQGKHLGANLMKLINGEQPEPFRYFDKGSMATIGRNRAVVDLGKIHFRGFFAWFIWMFVHLVSLAGFRNKVVTFVNWTWSYFSYDRGTRLIIRPFKREPEMEDPQNK